MNEESTNKYRGVTYVKLSDDRKYHRAQISLGGKTHYLGHAPTEEGAAKLYDNALFWVNESEIPGRRRRQDIALNFPEDYADKTTCPPPMSVVQNLINRLTTTPTANPYDKFPKFPGAMQSMQAIITKLEENLADYRKATASAESLLAMVMEHFPDVCPRCHQPTRCDDHNLTLCCRYDIVRGETARPTLNPSTGRSVPVPAPVDPLFGNQ